MRSPTLPGALIGLLALGFARADEFTDLRVEVGDLGEVSGKALARVRRIDEHGRQL